MSAIACKPHTYASIFLILVLYVCIRDFCIKPVYAWSFLIQLCNGDQGSIRLLLQLTDLDHFGDHFSDILGFQAATNMLLESTDSCWLASQIPDTDIIKQPIDPFATLSDRYDALGTKAQLLSGSPGNARAPMHVFERECCGSGPMAGCSDSSQADGSLGSTSKEGAQCGVLVDTVVNHAGKVEIFLLGRLIRPWQLGDLLLDRAFNIDQFCGAAVPAVELAAFHGELGWHLSGCQLWSGIPGAQFRTQYQKTVEQAVIDCLALQCLE